MSIENEINDLLTPGGKSLLSLLKEDIPVLAKRIERNENIVSAAASSKVINYFLVLLTSERLLTTLKQGKEKILVEYILDGIKELSVKEKLGSMDIQFRYQDEEIKINLNDHKLGKPFVAALEKSFGRSLIIQKTIKPKKIKPKKPISINIAILNGKEQLSESGKLFELIQVNPGEITIEVDRELLPGTYSFVKWDRVENIQKSALDIAGWTAIGSAWGGKGAIAGAMGANVGKDKSVATLFLTEENGNKIALVIRCNKKDLEKLSLFILANEEIDATPQSEQTLAVDDLIKLKELVDAGVITDDEFSRKKKQLLGI